MTHARVLLVFVALAFLADLVALIGFLDSDDPGVRKSGVVVVIVGLLACGLGVAVAQGKLPQPHNWSLLYLIFIFATMALHQIAAVLVGAEMVDDWGAVETVTYGATVGALLFWALSTRPVWKSIAHHGGFSFAIVGAADNGSDGSDGSGGGGSGGGGGDEETGGARATAAPVRNKKFLVASVLLVVCDVLVMFPYGQLHSQYHPEFDTLVGLALWAALLGTTAGLTGCIAASRRLSQTRVVSQLTLMLGFLSIMFHGVAFGYAGREWVRDGQHPDSSKFDQRVGGILALVGAVLSLFVCVFDWHHLKNLDVFLPSAMAGAGGTGGSGGSGERGKPLEETDDL